MPNPYAPPESDAGPEADAEPHHPVAEPPARRPTIRDTEDFVSVYTVHDLMAAEMLTQMLESEGIATPGFSRITGSNVGAGLAIVGHSIKVPESKAELARELIEAFLSGSPNDAPAEPEEYEALGPAPRSAFKTTVAVVILVPLMLWVLAMTAAFGLSLARGH